MNDLILLAKLLKYKKDAQTVDSDIASAYTACEDKGATLPQTQDSANLPDTIESIPTGGSVVTEQALNLYDWEGTLLQSYTAEEASALTALPNPADCPMYATVDHEYLLFQEWNWSLANIKTWIQNHIGEALFVGAIYTTTDSQNHKGWDDPRLDNDKLVSYFKKGNGYLNNQQWFNFTSLRAVSLMYKITNFGTQVFQNCNCLKSINIPSETTNIGQNAFASCNNLNFVSLPAELTTIGTSAFQSCSRLESINIPDSVTTIGQSAFQNCTNLESIKIPNGVTTIGNSAFTSCIHLKTIDIPSTVTSIGQFAFSSCTNLRSIKLSDEVASIQQYTFSNCYTLLSLDIPSSVTTIYQYAFENCYSLKDIILRGKPSLTHTTAFNTNPNTQKIYVPRANLSWFETATNWSTMYSKFVAIEDNIAYLESLGYNVDAYKGGVA